jgi:hypothetical protein
MRQQSTSIGIGTTILVALLMLGATSDSHSNERPRSTDLVANIMAHLGFGASHRQALLEGEILFTGMPDLEPMPHAVAVAGAMLVIQRPWRELVDAYLSDETLRVHSDVVAFGAMPAEGGEVDVLQGLTFDGEDEKELRRLLRVRPGREFNLGWTDIDRFQAIEPGDAALREAVRLYRETLWARVEAYRSGGLLGMPPYARKSGAEAFPANEMSASLDSARYLEQYFQELHGALRHYPNGVDQVDESQLLWIKKVASKRPLVTLVHRLVQIDDDNAVAAEREFFVGHTYNSMLTLVGIAPYENGTLVFASIRTFSEKVGGGGLSKSIGRKLVGKKFAERFARLREAMEVVERR